MLSIFNLKTFDGVTQKILNDKKKKIPRYNAHLS